MPKYRARVLAKGGRGASARRFGAVSKRPLIGEMEEGSDAYRIKFNLDETRADVYRAQRNPSPRQIEYRAAEHK